MISRLKGTLVSRELDHIEVETAGGVVYEIRIPLSILERLPKPKWPCGNDYATERPSNVEPLHMRSRHFRSMSGANGGSHP